MTRKYFCCDERRRAAVLAHSLLNGIDFLEVRDVNTDPLDIRQRILTLHFLKPLPQMLGPANFLMSGGDRIRNIVVTEVEQVPVASPPSSPPSSPPADLTPETVRITVSAAGDFSTYTLRIVSGVDNDGPPLWLDPVLSAVDFSFKVACPSPFDCAEERVCPPDVQPAPQINYLSKDYASFRQLLLDRLAVLVPQWTERSAADPGIALVELLAYLGDRLSYEQDARHTEAYLATARKRTSVRRHARLVDYFMHDGCNARTWIRITVREDVTGLRLRPEFDGLRTAFFTRVAVDGAVVRAGSQQHRRAIESRPIVFEPLEEISLEAAHNRMSFYTWGDAECCLPAGAVRATLRGHLPLLESGLVLVFSEVLGPRTGHPADADPSRRHAVRLVSVVPSSDPLGGRFEDPPNDNAVDVTEIEWAEADALPFALCVSARSEHGLVDDVSVAWGNIVLADHGHTLETPELLRRVPEPDPALVLAASDLDRCSPLEPVSTPVRYRPVLASAPVTQATPYDVTAPPSSALEALRTDARAAAPAVVLRDSGTDLEWLPQRDLLSSGADDREFVVEVEEDARAQLRFGDDVHAARPPAYTQFEATYRVGNGTAGNIGGDALAHVLSADPEVASETGESAVIRSITNPVAASGGVDPESSEQARRNAPEAFRTQARAVTEQDYADKAMEVASDIQHAAGIFRWTGSWYTAFVTADRIGGLAVTPEFETDLRAGLERFRMAGHDLEVDAPRPVPLEIEFEVCLRPGYFASDVKRDLLNVFSERRLPDGSLAVFHPDNFGFGQPLHLSRLLAAAQNVAGVASVTPVVFQRQGKPETSGLDDGRLEIGLLEIAQLANNPNFPERGVFVLEVHEAAS